MARLGGNLINAFHFRRVFRRCVIERIKRTLICVIRILHHRLLGQVKIILLLLTVFRSCAWVVIPEKVIVMRLEVCV